MYCSTVNSNISQALFADYDSGLRPVCGDSTQVNATLGMALRQVIDMVSCVKLDQLFYANMYVHEMKEAIIREHINTHLFLKYFK